MAKTTIVMKACRVCGAEPNQCRYSMRQVKNHDWLCRECRRERTRARAEGRPWSGTKRRSPVKASATTPKARRAKRAAGKNQDPNLGLDPPATEPLTSTSAPIDEPPSPPPQAA